MHVDLHYLEPFGTFTPAHLRILWLSLNEYIYSCRDTGMEMEIVYLS
jgi:hypothetical protein